jgi:polyhydroxyalkanoate synthesis regulator protein
MGKQNIALFERAMQMFSPFAPPGGVGAGGAGAGGAGAAGPGGPSPAAAPQPAPFRSPPPAAAAGGATIDTLLQRLNDLQRQIDGLTGGKR